MMSKKTNEIVTLLRELQNQCQKKYYNKIKESPVDEYDRRGIWLTVNCGCGEEYSTPNWIRNDGICHKCKKKIFTFQKVKED